MPEVSITQSGPSFGQGGNDSDSVLRNLVRSMQLDPALISAANRLRSGPIPNISQNSLFGRGYGGGGNSDATIRAITQNISTLQSSHQSMAANMSTMVSELRQVIGLLGNIAQNTSARGRGRRPAQAPVVAGIPAPHEETVHLDLPSMVPARTFQSFDQYSRATRGADANIRRWTEGPARRYMSFRDISSETAMIPYVAAAGTAMAASARRDWSYGNAAYGRMPPGGMWGNGSYVGPRMLGGPGGVPGVMPGGFRGTTINGAPYQWGATPSPFSGNVNYGGPPGFGPVPPIPPHATWGGGAAPGAFPGGAGAPPGGGITMFGGMGGGFPPTMRGMLRGGEILAAPILISKAMQGWSNLASEQDKYIQVTNQLARGMTNPSDQQGGFNAMANRSAGWYIPQRNRPQPGWLSTLGLSPLRAAQLASTYAIAPRSQSEADLISTARGGVPFMRGLGQLNPGTSDALIMQGGMMGIGNITNYTSTLDSAMTHAIMNSMPTEGLAAGFMSTNDVLASMGGGNLDASQIANFNTGMQDIGLAGMRTGMLGPQILQDAAGGFGQAFGGNAPAANTLGNLVLDIKSNNDLASRMGMSPAEFQAKMASTSSADRPFQDMVKGFWQSKQQGFIPGAGAYLQAAAGFSGGINPQLMMINESRDILLRQGFKESDPRFSLMQAAGAGLTGAGGLSPLQEMESIKQGITTGGATGVSSTGPGNRPTRDRNPAAIQYGAFAISAGAIGSDRPGQAGGLAIFPTAAAGMKAHEQLLFNTPGYSNLTISRAMSKWVTGNPDAQRTPELQSYISTVLSANSGQDVVVSTLDPSHRQAVMEAQRRAEGWQGGGELIDPRLSEINRRQNTVGTANVGAAGYASDFWTITLGHLDQVFKDAAAKIDAIMSTMGPAFQHASGP